MPHDAETPAPKMKTLLRGLFLCFDFSFFVFAFELGLLIVIVFRPSLSNVAIGDESLPVLYPVRQGIVWLRPVKMRRRNIPRPNL